MRSTTTEAGFIPAEAASVMWRVLAPYCLISLVHLAAALADADRVAQVTQWLALIALVGGYVALTTRWPRRPAERWVIAALCFSWAGDALPDLFDGDTAFLVKVGFFLIAQLCYITAFARWFRATWVARFPVCAVGYLAAIGLLVALCAPHAGSLLVPVLIYGACLGAMAALSSGVTVIAGLGGALFLISDGLIALRAFVPEFALPRADFWVMATYLVAQLLLVIGMLHRTGRVMAVGN